MDSLVQNLKELRANALKGQIEEFTVAESIAATCKPTNKTGEWIRSHDITSVVREGKTYLNLAAPGGKSLWLQKDPFYYNQPY